VDDAEGQHAGGKRRYVDEVPAAGLGQVVQQNLIAIEDGQHQHEHQFRQAANASASESPATLSVTHSPPTMAGK